MILGGKHIELHPELLRARTGPGGKIFLGPHGQCCHRCVWHPAAIAAATVAAWSLGPKLERHLAEAPGNAESARRGAAPWTPTSFVLLRVEMFRDYPPAAQEIILGKKGGRMSK